MPTTPFPDYYEMLEVDPSATVEEIKKAAKRALRKAHPDLGGSAGWFRAIQIAGDVLTDPNQRARYDRQRASNQSFEAAQDEQPGAHYDSWRAQYDKRRQEEQWEAQARAQEAADRTRRQAQAEQEAWEAAAPERERLQRERAEAERVAKDKQDRERAAAQAAERARLAEEARVAPYWDASRRLSDASARYFTRGGRLSIALAMEWIDTYFLRLWVGLVALTLLCAFGRYATFVGNWAASQAAAPSTVTISIIAIFSYWPCIWLFMITRAIFFALPTPSRDRDCAEWIAARESRAATIRSLMAEQARRGQEYE